jgi:Ca2+-binding EF-hand superfamily protein
MAVQDSDQAPGLSFYEFLVWARRLRDIAMSALSDVFQGAKAAGHGRVNVEAMLKAVAKLGFTLLENAADELLRQTNLERSQTSVSFSTFVRFVDTCRRTHGFTGAEIQELLDLYTRFDYENNDELGNVAVLNLLRYQGHTTKLIDAQNLMKQVDFNDNGTMDRLEFQMLMRLQREQVIVNARYAFDKARGNQDALPAGKLASALALCGIVLQSEEVAGPTSQDLAQAHEGCEMLHFDAFVQHFDRGQSIAAAEARKRAGFSIVTFQALRGTFRSYDVAKTDIISTGELMSILSEVNVPLRTCEEREVLMQSLDAARDAALEAGCKEEEVGEPGHGHGRNQRVFFWEFIHLVRGFVTKNEEKASDREKEVVEETKFSASEISEFRQVFGKMVKEQSLERARQGLGSVLQDLFSESALFNDSGNRSISLYLSSLGLRVSTQQREDLEDKIEELTTDQIDMDFACFLQLMRWLLDTDYAHVTGTAKRMGRLAARAHSRDLAELGA